MIGQKQKGFTLIELVVVIVILGLLAASALPRFINVTTDARKASVKGMAGGISSAASVAKAAAVIKGLTGAGTIDMSGTTVTVNAQLFPTGDAPGIGLALQGTQGFNVTYGATTVYEPENGGGANCRATYVTATGAAGYDDSNC